MPIGSYVGHVTAIDIDGGDLMYSLPFAFGTKINENIFVFEYKVCYDIYYRH